MAPSWPDHPGVELEAVRTVLVARALDARLETWSDLRHRILRNVAVRNDT
jgi:hypothetical protein